MTKDYVWGSLGETAMTPQEHGNLKPCPLCGSRAKRMGGGLSQELSIIVCTNCAITFRGSDEMWNTRHGELALTPPDELRKLADELSANLACCEQEAQENPVKKN